MRAGNDGRKRNGMDGDSDGFKHGGFGKAERVREFIGDALQNDDVFGKRSSAAVIAAGDAENPAAVTEIDFAARTMGTTAARDRRIKRDAIAFAPSGDLCADGGDAAGRFVTHDDGGNAAAGRAIVTVDISARNSASSDPDKQFARSGNGGRKIGNLELPVLGKKHRFHREVRSVRP